MAKGNVRNVIVGAAATFIGPAWNATTPNKPTLPGTAITASTDFDTTATGLGTGWRYTGFTQEGLEISYEPDFGEVEVDQLLDSAVLFKQSMRVMANTTFAEATLENLLVVWAQTDASLRDAALANALGAPAGSGTDSELNVTGGELGDYPVERQFLAAGKAPRPATGSAERVYWAKRVLSIESSAHALRRNEATVFPVSFRLLPTGESGADYGVVRDRIFA